MKIKSVNINMCLNWNNAGNTSHSLTINILDFDDFNQVQNGKSNTYISIYSVLLKIENISNSFYKRKTVDKHGIRIFLL